MVKKQDTQEIVRIAKMNNKRREEKMEQVEFKKCPRCEEMKLHPIEIRNAITRSNNAPYTYICSDCGRAEAIEDLIKQGRV